jgi:hypothetical protein
MGKNENPVLSSERDDWLTPVSILERVRKVAKDGKIALDPCGNPQSKVDAARTFTGPAHAGEDGLEKSWTREAKGGLVYANPPYGAVLGKWAEKASLEGALGAEIIFLCPARTDTQYFLFLLEAKAICFLTGRVKFLSPGPGGVPVERQGSTFPTAVSYFGTRPERFVNAWKDMGWIVRTDVLPRKEKPDGKRPRPRQLALVF